MSILDNFFGKKPASEGDQTGQPEASQQPASAETNNNQPAQGAVPGKPEKIRVYDSFGREMAIPREEWRANFLEKGLKESWDKPDQLSFMIIKAVEDGFEADVLEAAKHLRDIDEKKERGWTILGITYMASDDLDNAGKVFSDYIEQFGESAAVLTNLAKVCARRGENTVAGEMLWHSLELDPNQDNAFMWFIANAREKSPQAAKEAVNRIATLPNSWRARVWQAHEALEASDLDGALALYKEVLDMSPKPVAPDILQQISGDLGTHGHLIEVLKTVGPHYQPAVHGIVVGSNLIKAHFDLGQLDSAKSLVEMLFSMKRPDWHKPLSFWDMQIARVRSELATDDVRKDTQIELLAFDGPTWLRKDIPAAALCPQKTEQSPIVALTSSSFATLKNEEGKPRIQVSNIPGIMSRALTAFIVEQIHFRTEGIGRILQPWIASENGGFALFAAPCDDKTACTLAKNSPAPAGFVAVPHIAEGTDVWTATIRLLKVEDGVELGSITREIGVKDPEPGFRALADDFLKLIEEKAAVKPAEAPAFYQLPTGPDFMGYQVRLEQALIVSISATSPARSRSLHGERDIVEGTLRMCLAHPENGTLRLVLARILSDMRRIHPAVVDEYRERVVMLEKAKASPEPVLASVHQLLAQAFQS
jgi:tetratricopeptide (TPR) repeat protein